jgi:hypothetical protein
MRWSDEARAMRHPFRTYAELAASAAPPAGALSALRRPVFCLLVLGAFVSFTAAGRLVAFHLVSTMFFWSFAPLIQILVAAAVVRRFAPGRPLAPAIDLFFVGYGPWYVLLALIAGICLFAPDVHAAMMRLLALGGLPVLLGGTWIWAGVLTFAFFRTGLDLPRGRAAAATGLYYAGYVGVVLGWYFATNQIQPQLFGVP